MAARTRTVTIAPPGEEGPSGPATRRRTVRGKGKGRSTTPDGDPNPSDDGGYPSDDDDQGNPADVPLPPDDDDGFGIYSSSDDPSDSDNDPNSERNKFIRRMTKALCKGNSGSGKVKAKEPDTFDGSDPKKLNPFLVQCNIYFLNTSGFKSDKAKVNFVLSYLR